MDNKVTYTLVQAFKNGRGILKIQNEGSSSSVKHKVELSPAIRGYLKAAALETTMFQILDVPFTSTLTSPSWKENPFKLVMFKYEDGSFRNFQLKFVDDKGRATAKDAMGNLNYLNKYRKWSAKEYTRYFEVTTKLVRTV